MQELGILPHFAGIAIHDGWPSYYHFEGLHGLCNAHYLRELLFVFESTGQAWARDMMHLLSEIKHAVEASARGMLECATAAAYRHRYRRLIAQGKRVNPEMRDDPKRKDKRGGIKQSHACNLLRRLERYEEDVLRFMTHPLVPFENNLAECDIRMMKVKQKVSGCFRTLDRAKAFCAIRSYLATLRKQSKDLMAGLTEIFATSLSAAI
jgi:transposase